MDSHHQHPHHLHHHSMMAPPPQQPPHHHHHQPPPNPYSTTSAANNNSAGGNPLQQSPRFPFDSMNSPYGGGGDGSSPPSNFRTSGGGGTGGGFSIEQQPKKKRGRPRKYSPSSDGGNIALGLGPTGVARAENVGGNGVDGNEDVGSGGGGSGAAGVVSETGKKHRGRPPGSGKRQLDALGCPGVGFTPHVITVKAGEDIASKIMAFSQQGPRTICILSANGAISNVTLRQHAMSGGSVTYEGRFEIISLSGSFLISESNGSRNRTGGLSVSLAGSDGRVLGGVVAGMLMAASPVQVIVGSFITDEKKPKSGQSPTPPQPSNMLNFGGPVPGVSPPSEGPSSESSGESGSSPLPGLSGSYNNASQPMQNMPMYTNMGWPNSSINMRPN